MASVILVSPGGDEVTVSSTRDYVSYVYYRGFLPKVGTVQENYETLQGAPDASFSPRSAIRITDLEDRNANEITDAIFDNLLGRWAPGEEVRANDIRLSPAGQVIQRISAGLTRATYDGAENGNWTILTTGGGGGGGGVTDHGFLTGLADDDHAQYALADGSRGSFAALGHSHADLDNATDTNTGSALVRRTAGGSATFTSVSITTAPTAPQHAPRTDYVDAQIATRAPTTHTHTATQISDSTATGRSVVTAVDAAAARTAIGAGTSSLVLGTTAGTAKAGDYAPPTATTSAQGIVELATTTEATTGTDTSRAVTAAGVKAVADTKAALSHNHTSGNITDLTEAVQDVVGAFLVAGTGVTVSYDDVANTFTINATGGGGGTTDPEIVRDVIGTALVAGSGVQITVNDVGDTITIASTAVLPTRQVISGTGLTGGGDLSADRTLAVTYGTTAGTAAQGNDSRLSDARTPTTHTHTASQISDSTTTGRSVVTAADAAAARTAIGAGTSSLVLGTTAGTAKAGDYAPPSDAAATTASLRTLGTGALQAAAGNDARLSDARTPTTHTHTATQISDSTATGRSVVTAADAAAARTAIGAGTSSLVLGTTAGTAKAGDYAPPSDAAAGTPSMRTLGTGATQAAAGNDSRLSDARTPTTHTHTATQISDSTTTGRSVVTAADAAAARTAIGAGRVDSSDASVLNVVKMTQAAYDGLGTKVATTLYVIVG